MRYVLHAPTIWVAEISIYNVIAGTFLALAYVLLKKAHVGVDSVITLLSPGTALVLEILTTILAIVYCVVIDWEGIRMVASSYNMAEVSPTLLQVPMAIPQLFIPLGALFLTFQFFRLLWGLLKSLASGTYEVSGHSGEGAAA